jgi:hypothetical protein
MVWSKRVDCAPGPLTSASEKHRRQTSALAIQVQDLTNQFVELVYVDQFNIGDSVEALGKAEDTQMEAVRHTAAKRWVALLPRRWIAERIFASLVRLRRLARDDERLSTTLSGYHTPAFPSIQLAGLCPKVHNRP